MDQSEFENQTLKPASEVTTFFPPFEISPRKENIFHLLLYISLRKV